MGRSFPVPDDWAATFDAVPRSLFLPDLVWAHDMTTGTSRSVDRCADETGWLDATAEDVPIVTQWDDGAHHGAEPGTVPTSSASQPSVVAAMLDLLRVEPGMRVVEQGTGTGWNAALLAHRLGDANVTTVEIDPQVAAHARTRLHAAGYRPRTVCSDGAYGHPDGAPYDRVIATFGVRDIPLPWIEQTRPGGMLLVPFGGRYSNADALVRLTVHADGTASGPFLQPVEFMKMRSQRLTWPAPPPTGGTITETTTEQLPPSLASSTRSRSSPACACATSPTPSSPTTTALAPCGCTHSPPRPGPPPPSAAERTSITSASTAPADSGTTSNRPSPGGGRPASPASNDSASPSPRAPATPGSTIPAGRSRRCFSRPQQPGGRGCLRGGRSGRVRGTRCGRGRSRGACPRGGGRVGSGSSLDGSGCGPSRAAPRRKRLVCTHR
ncbi:methyltransferase domain-containing protein [Kitasatospora sp. NPDC059795]|uniref:methyltransferase domain-containing protein n=1 Tax=Kitasatospora sp. NPDC059795 TaxID=3346949 RepID=UPI00365CEB4D